MPIRIPAKHKASKEECPYTVTVHPEIECPLCGCEEILHIKGTDWYVCVNCHSKWR